VLPDLLSASSARKLLHKNVKKLGTIIVALSDSASTLHLQAQVVTGKYLTFLVKDGKLFGCGSNQFSVLGQGPMVAECRNPVEVEMPIGCRVKQISATHHHVSLVTEMGEARIQNHN
jgi:alpha-tubulin suppressor-like RCC1 family protein